MHRDNNGLLEAERLIKELTPSLRVKLMTCDLLSEGICAEIVSEAASEFGRLDYLVNCAGNPGGFFYAHEASLSMFDMVHSLNVRATWQLQHAAITQMLKQDLRNNE